LNEANIFFEKNELIFNQLGNKGVTSNRLAFQWSVIGCSKHILEANAADFNATLNSD